MTNHEPGNELHIIPEVKIPGGTIDYVLVSLKRGVVVDFVGIEFQTLDTSGTVWPERQRLLIELGVVESDPESDSNKQFGINWKMTAKTILVQMHHKVISFEFMRKHLVLIIQNPLLDYIMREFDCSAFNAPDYADSVHIHTYSLEMVNGGHSIQLDSRLSTDSKGIKKSLGLNTNSPINAAEFEEVLLSKISKDTLFTI